MVILGVSIDGLIQLKLSAVLFKFLLEYPKSLKIKLGHISRLLKLIKTGFKMPQYSSPVFTGCVGMQRFSSFVSDIKLEHNSDELRKRLTGIMDYFFQFGWFGQQCLLS